VVDYGDLIYEERWLIKGRRLRAIVHTGPPINATEADRVIIPGTPRSTMERITKMTDVRADKKVTLSIGRWEDEMGNEVPAPEGATPAWSIDEAGAAFFSLVDNGDGTAVLSALGPLGSAVVHMEANGPGVHITGDEMYMAVPGDVQRATIATGPEEEVTPDA
jgi:hypothetical protein